VIISPNPSGPLPPNVPFSVVLCRRFITSQRKKGIQSSPFFFFLHFHQLFLHIPLLFLLAYTSHPPSTPVPIDNQYTQQQTYTMVKPSRVVTLYSNAASALFFASPLLLGLLSTPVNADCPTCPYVDTLLKPCNSKLDILTWSGHMVYQ
jgi:hypothetical protein